MKKAILLFILFGLFFAFAASEPESAVGQEDVEKIEGAIENIPINPETGEIAFDDNDIKTKADERIAKINEYVGPITKTLFGVELTLSCVFFV